MYSSTGPQVMSRWLLLIALCAGVGVACGDASAPSDSADVSAQGGDDASPTSDDGSVEVDVSLSDDHDGGAHDVEVSEVTDALGAFPSDLPIITDIDEDVDLSEFFPDAVGPDPDEGDIAAEPSDVAPLEDVDAAEGDVSEALADIEAVSDTVEDTVEEEDTFLADCENLGVSPQWAGSFEGAIEYHIPEALEDLFYPTDGILIVGGSLSFDIACVDSKLIVSGDMDGTANVAGEGDFPFSVGLAGYFNPATGLLNASLVDGMVVLYGLAEIYFSGDFVGTLSEEVFDGTWTASYDGTNFPLPPGDVPEADGLGTWSAQPAEVD